MKLEDFGPFVIFAAIYAAGTLGLPKISFMAYQVKVGEIPAAFVTIFGMPAVFGLTLGQFIANLGVEASPLAMISPVVSFAGLLIIYYVKKFSTLGGCIAYILLTSLWLSFLLPTVNKGTTAVAAAYSAFAGQFVAVMIGYVAYLFVTRTMLPKKNEPVNPH